MKISELTIAVRSADKAVAIFTQRYRANHYKDTVRKTLNLVRRDNRWMIAAEKSQTR